VRGYHLSLGRTGCFHTKTFLFQRQTRNPEPLTLPRAVLTARVSPRGRRARNLLSLSRLSLSPLSRSHESVSRKCITKVIHFRFNSGEPYNVTPSRPGGFAIRDGARVVPGLRRRWPTHRPIRFRPTPDTRYQPESLFATTTVHKCAAVPRRARI